MEPQIQYATTSDGLRIAFSTLGDGAPFVYTPSGPMCHIQLEWAFPEIRRWYERLAAKGQLVLYNGRGSALSDPDTADYSLDGGLHDLEAVVDNLGLERFALFGYYHGGPTAIAYAASHPGRVSHLILWQTWARARDRFALSPRVEAVRTILGLDWELWTENLAHDFIGWPEGEPAHRFAAFIRECTSQAAMRSYFNATDEYDVSDLLPQLSMPTLILHRRQSHRVRVDIARALASRIPRARLVLLEGTGEVPYLGDTESVFRAIDEFLSEGEAGIRATPELASGMTAVLFADIAESTALTERMGDAAFRTKARELDIALRAIIRKSGGTPIEGKLLGDGVLAVFTSARQAIEAALACGKAGDSGGLPLHLGLHAGDVIHEENNVYGGAVNIASRIAAESAPGEVLVSETIRGLARTSAGASFEDRGDHSLKGIDDPHRLYAVKVLD